MNKSIELTKVNSSKIRPTRVFSLSNNKVGKLINFGFVQRVYSRSTSLHNFAERDSA